jgi:DNA polymerase-3 subunit alpha
MIAASPGPGKLMLNIEQKGEFCVMLEPVGVTVAADRAFVERAEELLGRGMVQALD